MNIKVAIVQSENLYNHLQQNIVKMELQIKEAANKGAQIVVFPELSACGYIPNQSIWKYAEELGGNLTKWCCDLSKKLEIYIGVGFIEKKDNHFYNSYILAGTEGEICGVIRKELHEKSLEAIEPILKEVLVYYQNEGVIQGPIENMDYLVSFLLYGVSAVLHTNKDTSYSDKKQAILALIDKLLGV